MQHLSRLSCATVAEQAKVAAEQAKVAERDTKIANLESTQGISLS
jgi:hypothetical protein